MLVSRYNIWLLLIMLTVIARNVIFSHRLFRMKLIFLHHFLFPPHRPYTSFPHVYAFAQGRREQEQRDHDEWIKLQAALNQQSDGQDSNSKLEHGFGSAAMLDDEDDNYD